jgi:hypothetical protein
MTRRLTSRLLPDAPSGWDPSSQEVWNRLIRTLESSDLFDRGRRTRPQFIVKGTVSAPVTLDLSSPSVSVLTHIVGKLLLALQPSNFTDVREDL